MYLDLTEDKSILAKVMTLCLQVTLPDSTLTQIYVAIYYYNAKMNKMIHRHNLNHTQKTSDIYIAHNVMTVISPIRTLGTHTSPQLP